MRCPICNQKMDLAVVSHKSKPFVDNKTYDKICFTCYSVPKTVEQKYFKDGTIKEDKQLEYCIDNIHSAQELMDQGSADNLNQARNSVNAVKQLKVIKNSNTKYKPKQETKLIT